MHSASLICLSIAFVSCNDDGNGTSLNSITGSPSNIQLDFTSNSTATVVFEKKASEQSHFQIRMTDGFGIAIEFKDLGDSPLELTDIPKGRILTVEMAGGNSSKIGDYGNETAPMLASALNDKHNMVCIDLLSAINDSNSTF